MSDRPLSASDASGGDYLLANADARAGQRFDALERLFDADTIAHLESIGVSARWSCWEPGAGSGSIARWLAGRVGPEGRVLATDIDPQRLAAEPLPGLTVARHDVVVDDIPRDAYDLVHARLLLVHLPGRHHVLDRLVSALRPGGWILIEDFDNVFLDVLPDATPELRVFKRVAHAFRRRLESGGADTGYPRTLPTLLGDCGLEQVAGAARLVFGGGGTPAARLLTANYAQAGDAMVTAGLCTREELERVLTLLGDPGFVVPTPLLISAWGRRPNGQPAHRAGQP